MEGTGEGMSWAAGQLQGMEFGMLISIGMGTLLLLLWYVQSRKFSLRGLPPGPPAYPVVGNLHLLALAGKPPHLAMADLAKKYGPLMTMKLGSHTAIVASTAKYAKEILKTQNQHFASRGKTAYSVILGFDRMSVVWCPYGQHSITGRKIIQTELLSKKRVAAYKDVRAQEVLKCVTSCLEECEQGTNPICFDEKMSKLATRSISRMVFGNGLSLFGRNTSVSKALEDEFMIMVNEIFRHAGIFVIGDFIPSLKRFDIQGHEAKMVELAKLSDKCYSRIVEEHRDNTDKTGEPDFVDTLLSIQAKEGLSDNAVKAIVADIVFAGTDTTANQECWTFAELMRHPEVLKKAQEELDTVVGRNRLVKESDIPNLKYIQALIKESFRLHPGAGILPYESTADTVIDGYSIPAKTRVFVNNYVLSRDPASWKNPLDYVPERFINGDGTARDVTGHDFEMLPFGSGRRMCIGMNIGLLMLQYTVAQMLHCCKWSLPAGMKPEDVDVTGDFGVITPLKTKLQLVATPRLAPSVLNDAVAADFK